MGLFLSLGSVEEGMGWLGRSPTVDFVLTEATQGCWRWAAAGVFVRLVGLGEGKGHLSLVKRHLSLGFVGLPGNLWGLHKNLEEGSWRTLAGSCSS